MNQSQPVTPPVTPQVTKVTTKNPGRVAAGKRLAEYNRQKKLDQLVKEETPPLVKESQSNTQSQTLDYKIISVFCLIAIGGFLAYKRTKESPQKPVKQSVESRTKAEESESRPQQSVKSLPDPFLMQ